MFRKYFPIGKSRFGKNSKDIPKTLEKDPAPPTASKTVFINIDIPRRHPNFNNYKLNYSAQEKIGLMCQAIQASYDAVLQLEPDAASIIITAREYAITDEAYSKSIHRGSKKDMLEKMQAIVDKNDKLTIITPPALIRKERERSKAYKIQAYYKEDRISLLEKFETPNCPLSSTINKHILFNTKKVNDFISNSQSKFLQLSVKSYFLKKQSNDASRIKPNSHTKLTPFQEQETYKLSYTGTAKHRSPLNAIYSPGKKSNEILKIDDITIDLYICRELEILPKAAKNTHEPPNPADVQLILSDSIDLLLEHLSAEQILYFDSDYSPKHIIKDPYNNIIKNIVVYNYDILQIHPCIEKLRLYAPLPWAIDHFVKVKKERSSHPRYAEIHEKIISSIKRFLPKNSLMDCGHFNSIINILNSFYDKITLSDSKDIFAIKFFIYEIGKLILNDLQHVSYQDEKVRLTNKLNLLEMRNDLFIEACAFFNEDETEALGAEKIRDLLNEGIDVHAITEKGTSLYQSAIEFNNEKLCPLFESLGIRPNKLAFTQ